jgi:5'-3' exonuclease
MQHMLLDTATLVYRAFYALPQTLVGSDNQPINAVHGYLDMVARLVRDHRPERLVHVFDADWRPAARVAAYGGYKAQRPPDPEALPPQFDLLRAVLSATDSTIAEAPGWEADDAIAALCAQAAPHDQTDVVTGDRDLLQLVRDTSPPTRVLLTTRGVKDLGVFDEAAVLATYGVPASRYADFAILRGDPSDGLPGVKGVGEKTAQALVARYPSIAALLADADAQPPRLAASLHAAQGYLVAMQDVVPLRGDVDVEVISSVYDKARAEELGTRHKLNGAIERLRAAINDTQQ